ncbi:MAG: glycosyltransferase family 2 protein [Muribaculaceae bacterium]|nr:glycosyltransferase family 2 protein [Muribaculaceae bacterium]
MPKLSIITPVYNGGRTIKRCARSVLSQSMRDFEWIIVDDASKDTTPNKLSRLLQRDKRIRAFRNEVNRGASYSRYKAIKECRGDYIMFIDIDDALTKGTLLSIHDNIFPKQEYDIYVCNSYYAYPKFGLRFSFYNTNKCPIFKAGICNGAQALMSLLSINGITSSLCDKVYRREFLLAHCGDYIPLTIGEDLALNVRLFSHIKCIKSINYYTCMWTASGLGYKYYVQSWDDYVCAIDFISSELEKVCPTEHIGEAKRALADNYKYCMLESCLQRSLRGVGRSRIKAFAQTALQHPILTYLNVDKLNEEEVYRLAKTRIWAHKKYYLVTSVLNFLNRVL